MKECRKTHVQDNDGVMNTASSCNFMLWRKGSPFYPIFPPDKTLPRSMEPIRMQWKSKEELPVPNIEFWIPIK
jgi:hypothetical protein